MALPPPLAAVGSPPSSPAALLEGLHELHNASQIAVANSSNHLEVHDAAHAQLLGHPLRSPPMPGEDDDITPMNPFLAIILLYGVMLLMVGAQTGLFLWKKRSRKTYELVTLIGLWLMPAIFSFHLKFWRFLLVWVIYSTVTGRLLFLCTQKKLARTTPRQVYSFFLGIFRVCKIIGVAGYVLVLLEIFGLGPVMRLVLPKDLALDLVWYGVYFGIMGRDCAQVASDGLAAQLGNEGRQLVSRVNNW